MTDTNQVAAALRKDLQKAQALWKPHRMSVADKMVGDNKVSDTQSYIKMASFTDPGLPGPVGERQSGVEMRFDKVYSTTYTGQKYMGTVSFSREVWDDNQYRSTIVQNYTGRLMDRCADRREIVIQTEFFNEADTLTGPDSQFYGDSDHPLDAEAADAGFITTGVASNIVSPAMTVSIDLLNTAYGMFAQQVDNKGIIAGAIPPFDIECHPLRIMHWKQIKESVQEEPGTTDRGKNPWASLIGDIIGIPYATDEDRTCFRASDHRRFVWDRMKPTVTEITYAKDDTFWANVVFRIGKGIFDWRDVIYSFA